MPQDVIRKESDDRPAGVLTTETNKPGESVVHMNLKEYLSNHDVAYPSLTHNSVDGLPLGNGHMGGIVQARPYQPVEEVFLCQRGSCRRPKREIGRCEVSEAIRAAPRPPG